MKLSGVLIVLALAIASPLSATVTPTTTTLSSSLNPSIYGQVVTFSAVVTSKLGAPPDGEVVSFEQGSKILGKAPLSGGTAIFMIPTLPTGGADIIQVKAIYPGDSNFARSTSTVLVQKVDKATTSINLASSENPSNAGQSVIFTATVAPQYSGTATGTVTFNNGNTKLGIVPLSGGVAKFKASNLAAGSDSITAVYKGSASFMGSNTGLTQTVDTGTFVQGSMTWDSATRYYQVFVPAVLPTNPAMVIMLHGTQNTTTFDPTAITSLEWGWATIANQQGFIVVQPASTWNSQTDQWNWNAYFMDAAFPNAKPCGAPDCPDDSGFLRQLIINLTAQYNLNPKMVFVTGMSSGGQMTERIGVEISDLVAAISPASGQLEGQQALPPPVLVPGNVVDPISVQEWHGTEDTNLWPCNYGTTLYSGITFTLDTVDDTFNYWVQENSCTSLQTAQPLCLNGEPNNANDAAISGVAGSTGNTGTNCSASNIEVQFVWEPNVKHTWEPKYNAARWQFFASHPKQ